MPPFKHHFDGLVWDDTIFGAEPRWATDPSLEKVKSEVQRLWPSKTIIMKFYAGGAFNKLYSVDISPPDNALPPLILRASLPVDPRHKTLSEVATLQWVVDKISVPVPRVIKYDCSRDNDIGFEWVLMTKLAGSTLKSAWKQLDLSVKSHVVRQIAAYTASLFQHQLSGIGNIFPEYQHETNVAPAPGRIVSMPFFWSRRIHYDVDRGPFPSSYAWIETSLTLYEKDCLHAPGQEGR